MSEYGVVVIGGGNAALCAALSARQHTSRVLLLERAPEPFRGGNTRHTRDIRCAHGGDAYMTGEYEPEELLADLVGVTGETGDGPLARLAVAESRGVSDWMERHGVRWQTPLRGTLHLGRTNRFFLGGGKALVNAYYRTAQRMGIDVLYAAPAERLCIRNGRCEGVEFRHHGNKVTAAARAVVAASGGFEANLDWLSRYWGDGAMNYVVRGPKFNDGAILAHLLELDAKPVGNPGAFHAVAVDARSPRYDGGIVTRVDSIPFGIVVNTAGRRFADEGLDLWPKRYASWGGLIAEQPSQSAYAIFDVKARDRFIPSLYKPLAADSLVDLAGAIDVDRATLLRTVDEFNARAGIIDRYDPTILDGCATVGLDPPKSNWALPIDQAPFFAYPLRPGITFTYLGIGVDERARILTANGSVFENVYAAGEIMAGNILTKGYLAGFGLTIGTVFGRLAGEQAATDG